MCYVLKAFNSERKIKEFGLFKDRHLFYSKISKVL